MSAEYYEDALRSGAVHTQVEFDQLRSSMAPSINAASAIYGGLGTADDGPALSAAAAAGAAAGLPVLIPNGLYRIGTTFVLPTGVSIIGAGKGATVLFASASLSGQVIRNSDSVNGNDDITLTGFTVDANRANRPSETQAAVRIGVSLLEGGTGYCDRINVSDIEVRESNRLGLQFARIRDSKVQGNLVHDNVRDGITFYYDCSDTVVSHNRVYNVADDMLGFNAENLSLATTGSVESGSAELTVASATGAQIGDGIFVAGAGAASADLYTTILNIVGTTITLAVNASTTVSSVTVRVGTVGHAMQRMAVFGNILGGGTASQTAGSCIALSGVQDSNIFGNVCRDGFSAGITVSNWNTTKASNLIIAANRIITSGRNNPATDGSGILVAGARSVSSQAGKAGCERITIVDNHITDAKYVGIRCLTQTDGTVTDLSIDGNTILDSGTSASNQPAMYLDGIVNPRVRGNRCTDTRGTKYQTYGLQMLSPTGAVVVVDNDFNGNLTGRASLATMTGATTLNVDNNPGLTPFSGIATAAGGWTSIAQGAGTVYFKDIAVSYGVSFPTGTVPVIRLSAQHTGIGASPVSITNVGFTARLWAPNDPGSASHSVHWQAQ